MSGLDVKVDHIVKVGQLVKLMVKQVDGMADRERAEASGEGELPGYGTRIEDLLSDSLVVSWPTDQGIRVPASAGQNVSLEIKCPHGVLYLDSKITALNVAPVPLLQIARGGDWSRSQLRSNVRLAVTLTPNEAVLLPFKVEDLMGDASNDSDGDVDIDIDALNKMEASIGSRGQRFRSMVRDLSAGGILLISSIRLEGGSIIRIRLLLGKGQPDISALALVVRAIEGEDGNREYPYRAGCRFIGLSSRDEDNIIRYIFAKQAELRRSGML